MNKLSLRMRLAIMVAVPLLGMIWVSGWNTVEKLLQAREMTRMQGLVEVATRTGALIHELQKERGMSSGFIGSKGANFSAELPKQRGEVDKRLAALKQGLEGIDAPSFGTAFTAALDESRKQLADLEARRKAISALEIPAPDAIGYFTQTIGALLKTPGQLATLSSDKEIARLASSYGALLQAKERAGVERAVLSNVFGADKFAPEMLVRFLNTSSAQETWFAIFKGYATEEQRRFADDKLAGPAVAEVANLKQTALARMNEPSLGLDAKQWFAAATARIDLMKGVEDKLAADLTAAMQDLKEMSTKIAVFYTVSTILAVLLVFLLARAIVRRILAQIGGEPEDAVGFVHAVAEGKLDNQIAVVEGDRESIVASMDRMQTQLRERINEERRIAGENLRIKIALDNVSTGVMIADAERKIIYANQSVQRILKNAESDIRKQLPSFSADKLVGQNIDGFHKNPSHQARLLAEFTNTYTANLEIGGRHMVVSANPVISSDGQRLGAVAEWRDRTGEVLTQREVAVMVNAAAAGNFDTRIESEGKEGFFRELAEGLNRLAEVTSNGLSDVARVLQRVAQGDLTQTIEASYEGLFGQLKDDTNGTIERLREVVGRIQEATEAINTAAKEIAAGNQDLSSRTEEQASSLEETSSAMEELNATVKQNADNARQANELAKTSNAGVVRGGEVVKQVVVTMGDIQASSKKISDIIGVIDSIAFQTNILALNAAVEAARAGEQGRGFAVVATEVRNLAQRSATAAKEIKTLIAESVDKVESGAKLVQEAGTTMDEVVKSFQQVAGLVTEIANASREQSSGIEQTTQAVGQMDEVTQQNAALVEEAAAAAESLEEQARGLVQTVSMFKLAEGAGRSLPAPALRDATPRQLASRAPAKPAAGQKKIAPPHLADDGDQWEEF